MKTKLVVLAAFLASQAVFGSEIFQCNVLKDTHGHSLDDKSYQVSMNGSEVTLAVTSGLDGQAHSTIEMAMKKTVQEPELAIYEAGNARVSMSYGLGREWVSIQVGMYSASCPESEF